MSSAVIFVALLAIIVGTAATFYFSHTANTTDNYKRMYVAQDFAFLGGLLVVVGVMILLYALGGR